MAYLSKDLTAGPLTFKVVSKHASTGQSMNLSATVKSSGGTNLEVDMGDGNWVSAQFLAGAIDKVEGWNAKYFRITGGGLAFVYSELNIEEVEV